MLNSLQETFSISNFRLWKVPEWISHPKICRSASKNHFYSRIFENFPSCGLLDMFVKPNLHPIFMVPFPPKKWLLQLVITCALCPDDPGSNPTYHMMFWQSPAVYLGQSSSSGGRRREFWGQNSWILPILTTFWFYSPLLEGVSPAEFFTWRFVSIQTR